MQTSSSVQLLPKRKKSDKPGNDGTKKRRKRAKRRVWEVSLVDGTEAESASVLESYKYKEGYLCVTTYYDCRRLYDGCTSMYYVVVVHCSTRYDVSMMY